ncbi:MAG TPA: class I SAM-dependent methyltransferase [bacterium]|nr:class I SAM-dependent methyltransferase [bacterium]HOL47026.1 class I SAM-dependent methyltransferase [bacterium]HPQ18472.1 class I SAM-dependent methyltransferase [bacterium]
MEYINCPLCNSNLYNVLYEKNILNEKNDENDIYKCTSYKFSDYYRIVKCKECGLVYNNPREDFNKLLKFYEDVIDNDYLKQQIAREITYKKLLDTLIKYKNCGKLLDIGCYTGFFLKLAKTKNFIVKGIEPSKWAANYAKSILNLDVINTNIFDYQPFEKFDVITMWDVIEHLPNINDVFIKCNKMLNDKGIIAFSTHNIDSFASKLLKSNYPFIMRMHISHFSFKTIKYLLNKTGFNIVRIEEHNRYLKLDYFLDRLNSYLPYFKRLTLFIKNILPENKLIKINKIGLINCWAVKSKEI